ncbi:TD and POZ domain-containing protein 3 [Diachasma alloeum]|uniref:TD and POZ domain-containing protein 3 n=1 Tax=Diachasma alloeum TaxID=454923 RepID=UPI0007384664|nr:TD and POZ domain-containing protein 3 [Diachasma alloeum]
MEEWYHFRVPDQQNTYREWRQIASLPLKDRNNVTIWVRLGSSANDPSRRKLSLSIRKAVTVEIMADISIVIPCTASISFDDITIEKESFRWTDACDFEDLEIRRDLSFVATCKIKYIDAIATPALPSSSTSFSNNEFQPFLLQSTFSDARIIISGEELPVHKVILAAHSPVFLSMFESEMKEGTNNEVVISDVKLDVMKNVLSYLYTGSDQALNDVDMAMKMLIVAEKYNMEKLKTLCERKLFRHLTISNALQMLNFATIHNAQNLVEKVWTFVLKHKEKVVLEPYLETLCLENPGLMCLFTKAAING